MTAIPMPAPGAAHPLRPVATRPATGFLGRWSVRLLVATAVTASAVLVAGTTAASAAFSDSAALPAMTVGTGAVAPATNVRVDVSCVTTTTVVQLTYTVYGWGAQLTGYSAWSSTASAKSNVESDVTVREDGPRGNQYTTTRTTKDTELYASLKWTRSVSPRVTGYRMTAHTVAGDFDMGGTGPNATEMTARYDADVVDLGATLTIDTVTDYGWIGTSKASNTVKC
ncbi:hypothetical protein [Geodermatophilus sp. DSM 45219]|uniref:hypothetical protein n=1 Tax=Geodermatophilus sp. DSM 45219 TaxID=1881103 RepID=UPI0008808E1D|nr:hypothetical protein [Geodermatophilus sp. DSM 45219]SDO28205.1 hypothetical protein SAMN05428965_3323 [Geodermatophilus sp. DSM 45219]